MYVSCSVNRPRYHYRESCTYLCKCTSSISLELFNAAWSSVCALTDANGSCVGMVAGALFVFCLTMA